MSTILLTRPQHHGRNLTKRLNDRGYTVIEHPLLDIVPIISDRPSLSDSALVMITSRSAIASLHQVASSLGDLFQRPCYCVGTRTAEEAAELGFQEVYHIPGGNGERLASLIHRRGRGEILHICGQEQSVEPQRLLQEEGWSVLRWPVYRAQRVQGLTQEVKAALQQREIDAVLLFSYRTAQHFSELIQRTGLETCCRGLLAVGLSEAVLEGLAGLSGLKLVAAPLPTQEEMIVCVQRALPIEKEKQDD